MHRHVTVCLLRWLMPAPPCRRIVAWLGLAILLASMAGLVFHIRHMWLPALSDAMYGTRHGFRVNRYGRQVDDTAAEQDEGNVHLINIGSERSEGRAKGSQVAAPDQEVQGAPDESLAPSTAATAGAGREPVSGSVQEHGSALAGSETVASEAVQEPPAVHIDPEGSSKPEEPSSAQPSAAERLGQRPTRDKQ